MDEFEDREADDFYCDPFSGVVEEFDLDYEFDAPKFHDFTRREDDSEAEEAERWLDVASGYAPSPLALKRYWRPLIGGESNHSSPTVANSSVEDDDNETGSGSSNCKREVGSKPKEKSRILQKSLSFMSPTASHLAKKQAAEQIRCERLLRRFPKDAKSEGKSSRSSSTSGVSATKRQKLEAGYLRKAARMRHQAQFPHKESVKVSSKAASGRFKATIPIQPNLATANRAERHRSRAKSESEHSGQTITSPAETRPLNKKIQKVPSLPIPRKATRPLPELQGAKLHRSKSTSEKENRNLTSLNAGLPVKDRRELREKSKSFNIKGSTKRRVMDEPPVDAFSQLSLASKIHSAAHRQAKVATKENARRDPKQDKEIITTSTRPLGHQRVIPNLCRNGKMIASTQDQRSITRLGLAIK